MSAARPLLVPVALGVALLAGLAAPGAAAETCRLLLLVERGDSVAVETVALPEGEEVAVSRADLITVLLPFGPGQSGDLVQRARRSAETRARCARDTLFVRYRQPDGSFRALPPVPVADLSAYDMRVNITGADGWKAAVRISGYRDLVADAGPVIDMFQGRIPMAPGDFAITTEVSRRAERPRLSGRAPLRYQGGLIFTEVTGAGGRRGLFVVDLGAGATVVAREFLPPGAEIEPIEGVEHSAQGTRRVPGAMHGAGGEVRSLLGSAALVDLRIGEVAAGEVRANVVEALPELGGAPVAGILGLDVLSRASRVRLERDAEDHGTLTFASARPVGQDAARADGIVVPFTLVANHILLAGAVDGVPAALVLDTGARASLLPIAFAQEARLPAGPGEARELRGLDGRALAAEPVWVRELRLGETSVPDVVFYATDLTAVASLGLEPNSGLLGNDFLSRYHALEVDHEAQVVRLEGPVAGH